MAANEIFAQAIKNRNAVIDVTIDGVNYIAEALPTAKLTDAAWRCSAIFPLENGGRMVRQAAGFHAPGAGGVNLPALTYLPEEA